MTDWVCIKNLRVDTIIGVYDWERQVRQQLCLDLDMATDIRVAAASDNLADALDYHAISVRLTEFIEQTRFQLIETLAEAIATILQEEFAISWFKLSLRKPGAVANAESVGVMIERKAETTLP